MQSILALDVGERKTGVAFASGEILVAVVLPTIHHDSYESFQQQVLSLLEERAVLELVVGLPLLPSGEEGEQSRTVRSFIEHLPVPSSIKVDFLDERYSTPPSTDRHNDPDSAAACSILDTYLCRKNI